MAAPTIEKHGKWTDVKINPNVFLSNDFADFVCMQELTDYTVVTSKGKVVASKPKKKKTQPENEPSPQTQPKAKEPKKKKHRWFKKKKKPKIETDEEVENNAEVKDTDAEPTSQSEDRESDSEEENQKATEEFSKQSKRKANDDGNKNPPKKKKKKKQPKVKQDLMPEVTDKKTKTSKKKGPPDMSAWKEMFVPEPVLQALAEDNFLAPTPIQALAIAPAIRDRKDIVGAAETGSGKTLAFGIPVINSILNLKKREEELDDSEDVVDLPLDEDTSDIEDLDEEDQKDDGDDVDLTPDEDELDSEDQDDDKNFDLPPDELASDFEEGSDSDMSFEEFGSDEDDEDRRSEDSFVEGDEEDEGQESSDEDLSTNQKTPTIVQNHNKKSRPLYALILTPTRELAIQVRDHIKSAARYTGIQVVAIVGGMAAQKQERLLKRQPEIVVATPGRLWELMKEGDPHLNKAKDIRCLVIDEADRMVEKGHFEELTELLVVLNNEESMKRRQTFVFSATLTFVHSTPMRLKHKKKVTQMTEKQKIESLMEHIGVKPKPKIVDLTRSVGTAETLVEARLNCTSEEKDLYLYYMLRQYPGRTLVFTNSKDCIRRLVSIFKLLERAPLPLHADMNQKQRLKNLDRFKGNPKSLLLATDVAARGLDIPDVQHVIHYQVPRTTENYIHRSGRTARASKEGLSVMLVGPEDLQYYRKIIKSLNRDEDLPLFPINLDLWPGVKARVNTARHIDKQEHALVKQRKQNSWYEKAAKEMDIELDEDMLLNDLGDSRKQAQMKKALEASKLDLQAMLRDPLERQQFIGKYPTKSGKLQLPKVYGGSENGAVSQVKDAKVSEAKLREKHSMFKTVVKKTKKSKWRKKKK